LHETTQRIVCRVAFFAACVLPTLGVLAWLGWRHYPGRQAAELARWGQRLGVVIECESWATPRPDELLLSGVSIRSGESQVLLARCSQLSIIPGDTPRLSATSVEVIESDAAATIAIGRLLLGRDLAPPAQLSVSELKFVDATGAARAKWKNLNGELKSITSAGLITGRKLALTSAAARLTIERNRQLDSIGTHVVVNTAGEPISAAWLTGLGPICASGAFTGECEAFATGANWLGGELRGEFVDFNIMTTPYGRQFAALSRVKLIVEKCVWHERIDELNAKLVTGPGVVSRDLIRALYNGAQCYPSVALATEVNDSSTEPAPVAFDQLGIAINLQASGVALSGACGASGGATDGAIAHAILARGGERLLDEPRVKLLPLATCVQLLSPTSPIALPATSDAIELASYLPLTDSPRPPQSTEKTYR
jgi:hypothetical protein